MPEEMELNRESREKLAELMLEYPTKTRELEEEEAEETEQRRNYTCVNCKKSFKMTIWGGIITFGTRRNAEKYLKKKKLRTNAQTAT